MKTLKIVGGAKTQARVEEVSALEVQAAP